MRRINALDSGPGWVWEDATKETRRYEDARLGVLTQSSGIIAAIRAKGFSEAADESKAHKGSGRLCFAAFQPRPLIHEST